MSKSEDHPVGSVKHPNKEYSPKEVVALQVEALGENDTPHENAGIEVAYNFASPENRASTGPLRQFKNMVQNRLYRPMIDHEKASTAQIERNGQKARQEVTLTKDGAEYTYVFTLSKQMSGEWENCWMTDAVRHTGSN